MLPMLYSKLQVLMRDVCSGTIYIRKFWSDAATCRIQVDDDVQTGHHELALPIEVIENWNYKGPSKCIRSKCTGAVNIVTKDSLDNDASLRLQAGSMASWCCCYRGS
jgi:hypothetical protein